MMHKFPLVSVGIPTFNRVALLDEAIKCTVNQTYKNLEIIISDNATPGDEVEVLVKSYMDNDKRIIFKKHTLNHGGEKNFQYLINKAKGKYFLFAGDDDIRSLDFIEKNLFFLERNIDYVASISPVRFENRDFDKYVMGDDSIDEDDSADRVIRFYNRWHANGRFYSLIRRQELQKIYSINYFFGGDWIVIIRLLQLGKFKRISEGELILGANGTSHNSNYFSDYRNSFINWFIPFKDVTSISFLLLRKANMKRKVKLLLRLLKLNYTAFYWQSKSEIYKLYKKISG
jgi:glycosyltransferase involved in cell wall biosynthesis